MNQFKFHLIIVIYSNPFPNDNAFVQRNISIEITNDEIHLKSNAQRDRFDFWDRIFDEYKPHWNITFDFLSVWFFFVLIKHSFHWKTI